MESINTINKTLFGAALAVLALAMAIPQGAALARGGMELRTADLCLVSTELAESQYGIGTVAAVTDNRLNITAWAVSLEGMQKYTTYGVYDTGTGGSNCKGDEEGTFSVYEINTDKNGEAYRNAESVNKLDIPKVGDAIQICRYDHGVGGDIPILKGVLVKGGKEKNKPGRCPD